MATFADIFGKQHLMMARVRLKNVETLKSFAALNEIISEDCEIYEKKGAIFQQKLRLCCFQTF